MEDTLAVHGFQALEQLLDYLFYLILTEAAHLIIHLKQAAARYKLRNDIPVVPVSILDHLEHAERPRVIKGLQRGHLTSMQPNLGLASPLERTEIDPFNAGQDAGASVPCQVDIFER